MEKRKTISFVTFTCSQSEKPGSSNSRALFPLSGWTQKLESLYHHNCIIGYIYRSDALISLIHCLSDRVPLTNRRTEESIAEFAEFFRTFFIDAQVAIATANKLKRKSTSVSLRLSTAGDILLSDLLGPALIVHDGHGSESAVNYKDGLIETGTKVIRLYFGDHSNDKCREFISMVEVI